MADEDVDLRLRVLYDGRGVGQARAAIAQLRRDVEGTAGRTSTAAASTSASFGRAAGAVNTTRDAVRGVGTAADATARQSVAATARLEAGMGQAQRAVAGLHTSYRALAAGGIGILALRAVRAGSDLTEATTKAQRVFETSFEGVERFADNAARAVGLSRAQALAATADFGQLFQTVQVGEQAAAGMSTQLVQLAADLASFHNTAGGVPEALTAIRAGLVGEAEPLRRLGVFLSEARVQSEAFRLGIAQQGAELSDAQKVLSRFTIIMTDTVKAQGDFALTSGNVANRTRIAQAQLENAAASLSQSFLPAIADALGDVATLGEGLAGLPQPLVKAAVEAAALGAVLAVLAPRLRAVQAALVATGASSGLAGGGLRTLGASFLGFAGKAATGVGIFAILKSTLDDLGPSVDKAVEGFLEGEVSFRRFSEAAKEAADARRAEAATDTGKGLFTISGALGRRREFDRKESGEDDLEFFRKLAQQAPAAAQAVINTLPATAEGAKRALQYGRALQEVIDKKAKDVVASEQVAAATQKAADASKGAAASAQAEAEALDRRLQAVDDLVGSQRSLQSAQRGVADAEVAVDTAAQRVADARQKLNQVMADGSERAEKLVQAEEKLAQASERVIDADQRLVDAQATLNELLESGAVDAEEVARAERRMEAAARSSAEARERLADAERALEEARRGATADEITDKELALNAARRGAQQAPLDVQEAEKRLLDARRRGDPEAMRQAELDLAAARDGVIAADIRVRDAEADLAETRAKGGEGTREVVDAERGVVDARQAVADAVRDEADASRELAEAQAGDPDFARDIEDARRDLAAAEREAAAARRASVQAQQDLREVEAGDPDRIREIERARRELIAAERDYDTAKFNLSGTIINLAQAEVDEKERRARANDETISAREHTENLIAALERHAQAMQPGSPLRAYLEQFISQLRDEYNRTYTATLTLDASQAELGLRLFGERWREVMDRIRADTGNIFATAPGRQGGGPVTAGRLYRINERPNWPGEVFQPAVSGYVHPVAAVGGMSGGGSGDTYNIHPSPAMDEAALAEKVWRRVSFYKAR